MIEHTPLRVDQITDVGELKDTYHAKTIVETPIEVFKFDDDSWIRYAVIGEERLNPNDQKVAVYIPGINAVLSNKGDYSNEIILTQTAALSEGLDRPVIVLENGFSGKTSRFSRLSRPAEKDIKSGRLERYGEDLATAITDISFRICKKQKQYTENVSALMIGNSLGTNQIGAVAAAMTEQGIIANEGFMLLEPTRIVPESFKDVVDAVIFRPSDAVLYRRVLCDTWPWMADFECRDDKTPGYENQYRGNRQKYGAQILELALTGGQLNMSRFYKLVNHYGEQHGVKEVLEHSGGTLIAASGDNKISPRDNVDAYLKTLACLKTMARRGITIESFDATDALQGSEVKGSGHGWLHNIAAVREVAVQSSK